MRACRPAGGTGDPKGYRVEIQVDRTLCEANAVCVGLAPDVFELDDDEQLVILLPDPPAERVERVQMAVSRCPKNALRITGSTD